MAAAEMLLILKHIFYFLVCWLPHLEYVTRGLNLSHCANEEDYVCISNYFHQNINVFIDQTEVHKCKFPCVEFHYTTHEREDPFLRPERNEHIAYFFYESTSYPYEEEELYFDLNAIVSAVGGSLGLFLGFSCWNFFQLGHAVWKRDKTLPSCHISPATCHKRRNSN